jgi:hypothetical protein
MRSEVAEAWLVVPAEHLSLGRALASDLRAAGHIGELHVDAGVAGAAGAAVQVRI